MAYSIAKIEKSLLVIRKYNDVGRLLHQRKFTPENCTFKSYVDDDGNDVFSVLSNANVEAFVLESALGVPLDSRNMFIGETVAADCIVAFKSWNNDEGLIKNSQEIDDTAFVSFSTDITILEKLTVMSLFQVTEAIELSVDSTKITPNCITVAKIVADGVSDVTISGAKEIVSSAGYDNTEGILNTFYFFYDGVNVFVNIFQEKDALPIDLLSPSVVSAEILNLYRDEVLITFDESLNESFVPALMTFVIEGKEITAIDVTTNTVTLTVSEAFEYRETGISVSYTPSGVRLQDAASNKVVAFTESVTNSIAAPDLTAPTIQSAVISNSVKNKVLLTYNEALNPNTTPANSTYTIAGKTVSGVVVSGSTVLVTVTVDFAYGDTVVISYTQGVTKLQDEAGNFAASFAGYSVTNNIQDPTSTVSWTAMQNASQTVDNFLLSNNSTPGGGRSSQAIDATQPFEITMFYPTNRTITDAIVSYLSVDTTSDYAWSGNVFILGVYQFSGSFYLPVGGYAATPLSTTGTVTSIKFVKSGNDILVQQSTNDSTYTTVQTVSGALSGKATIYLKSLFAAPSGTSKIKIIGTWTQP